MRFKNVLIQILKSLKFGESPPPEMVEFKNMNAPTQIHSEQLGS